MNSYIYFSSLREFARFKRVAIWIFLAIVGMILAAIWPRFMQDATPEDRYSRVALIVVFHVLALASAIFTTAVVSQEVEQKTIVYLLTRPVARWRLLLMRYLASATVVAVLGVIGAVCVSLGVYGFNFGQNALFAKDCIALTCGAVAYGALFLLISLFFNRAMIICLLFAFGWETSVPNMPGEMYRLSILSQLQAIADHHNADSSGNMLGGMITTTPISITSAYLTLLILSGVLIAFAAAWFTKSEIIPREDAE